MLALALCHATAAAANLGNSIACCKTKAKAKLHCAIREIGTLLATATRVEARARVGFKANALWTTPLFSLRSSLNVLIRAQVQLSLAKLVGQLD